jgi:hypothetical protein
MKTNNQYQNLLTIIPWYQYEEQQSKPRNLIDFGFIAPKNVNYMAFQSFNFLAYLMKVIPETRRAHYI